MSRRKFAPTLFASLVLAPVLAAGRPACCIKSPTEPVASRPCCAAMSGNVASSPKGCCKAPAAPRPETRASGQTPLVLAIPALTFGAPALASVAVPEAVSARLARRAHRAIAPDESPPDLLSHLHILLI